MAQRPGFQRTNTERHEDGTFELTPYKQNDPGVGNSKGSYEFRDPDVKEGATISITHDSDASPPEYEDAGDGFHKVTEPVETAKDIVTQVLHVDDDPTLSPYTFRLAFLGIGLSIFGSVLQEIFYFKPQTIYVSVVFLCVIAYVLGEFMAFVIPRKGVIGRYLNPFPFNQKEHAAITLMASAAAQAATSTEALAAQELFYGGYPSKAAGVFITLSSQLIGFGIAGILRNVLVYPTKMLWPGNLPIATLLETLHRDKAESKRRLKLFYIVFAVIFCWEAFPEYIFTVLTGVSIFCLADQHNLVFTNLFGGASGNEGLGMFSFCFDWNYIAGLQSPLWYPLQTMVNMMIGIYGCYILFMAVYYGNVWRSLDFPFLSQELFDGSSNSTNYVVYNQSLILNDNFEIDKAKLEQTGIPYLTGTYIAYLITSNMGMTAGLVHMLLWNYNDMKIAWTWAHPRNLKKLMQPGAWKFWEKSETPEQRLERKQNDPELDPHYKLMLRNLYVEVPMWWWAACLVVSWVVGVACLYAMKSTLPWWGFLLSTLLTTVFILFFGAMYGITGFGFNLQPIAQMLAGYMFPGRPLANFYFTCYTYNACNQGMLLARDLKLAQYVHLPPTCTFVVQVAGCVIGALFNWVMMVTIVKSQAPILTSIQGTNIWSGQNIQQFNTLAIAWSIASEMFSVGARYQWVTISYLIGFIVPVPLWLAHRYTGWKVFSYFNTCIILWFMGNLFVGINSSLNMFFIIGFVSQFWLRKYHATWFVKYNYLLSAALDGGTQVLVFIFTFAVFGGSGKAVSFPTWAGNPDTSTHNIDYCMVNAANNG
ncbi:OPT superfamily oligopeptide transporter [Teratosphaeria nubilosa]|uniref:OPT superfamily oligopeptide transporter n=1 Tax=Teratosphaeria nubilosa TaxID=161662 RepID=A0A6G1L6Y1_9PEZI|nr:OPT superfamily oligopeptide transporter [Teratosphaeria nubilosa]